MTKIDICELIWWLIKILCLWYLSPMKQVEKPKLRTNMFWWIMKTLFWCNPFYVENIIYLAKIVRALSSNKIVFLHFCKKSTINSYKTVREVNKYLYNNFEKNGALHNSMTKLCSAFFLYENNVQLFINSTHSFVANELLTFCKNAKKLFYCSRELSLFWLNK